MGFNREAARQALMDNNNNLEVALNSLLTGSCGSRPGPVVAESNKPQPRGMHTHTHTHCPLLFAKMRHSLKILGFNRNTHLDLDNRATCTWNVDTVHFQTSTFICQSVPNVSIILFWASSQSEEREGAGPEMKMRTRERGEDRLDQALCLTFWNPRWGFYLLMVGELVPTSFKHFFFLLDVFKCETRYITYKDGCWLDTFQCSSLVNVLMIVGQHGRSHRYTWQMVNYQSWAGTD